MAKKLVKVMNTAFRDGFQSVFGARVFTRDFMPAVEASRDAGITHFEAGGGARFQSLYFYCNEDAFDMMDTFRQTVGPDANLQTLGRGINVVALDSQPGCLLSRLSGSGATCFGLFADQAAAGAAAARLAAAPGGWGVRDTSVLHRAPAPLPHD